MGPYKKWEVIKESGIRTLPDSVRRSRKYLEDLSLIFKDKFLADCIFSHMLNDNYKQWKKFCKEIDVEVTKEIADYCKASREATAYLKLKSTWEGL